MSEETPAANCDCFPCHEWKEIIRKRFEILKPQDIDKIPHYIKEMVVKVIIEAQDLNDEKEDLEEEIKRLKQKIHEHEEEALEHKEYDY